MKSPVQSCFATLILAVVALALIRFTLPGLWHLLVALSFTFATVAALLVAVMVFGFGFFIYRNLRRNRRLSEEKKYEKVLRVRNLYASVEKRLQQNPSLNLIPSEEMLQAEVLMSGKLDEVQQEIVRLKDATSLKRQSEVDQQLRDYRRQYKEADDA